MSKADSSPTPILPRRAVLAGIASAAALPIAAAVPASPEPDPAFALIAAKRAADVVHNEAIDAEDRADIEHGGNSKAYREAANRSEAACWEVHRVDWELVETPPTTLAGVAAVLRFANQIEDEGMEWPYTDTIGPEGWHYQLRATMASAIEALIKAGKAVA